MRPPFLLCMLAVASCADSGAVELHLIHPSGLDLAASVGSVRVELVEVDTGAAIASAETTGAELGRSPLWESARLEVGSRYRAELEADATVVCTSGLVRGRSPQFVHDEAPYSVSLQIGCAGEFAPTRGLPALARMGSGTAVSANGSVLIAGGAGMYDNESQRFPPDELRGQLEHYDPSSGRFVPAGELLVPRAQPSLLPLASGETAIIGGYTGSFRLCTEVVEVHSGLGTKSAINLPGPRCGAAVLNLPEAEVVAMIGGNLSPDEPTVELFDDSLRHPIGSGVSGGPQRAGAHALALADGRSALIVGGIYAPDADPDAFTVLLRVPEEGTPQLVTIPVERPRPGLPSLVGASYASCDDGSGAVYVTGGEIASGDQTTALADVWCYRDVPGQTAALEVVGSLPEPRYGHLQVTVDGAEGHELLLIGGNRSDSMTPALPYMDALRVPVSGCECSMMSGESVERTPLPFRGFSTAASATRLPDGSVLLTGGFDASADGSELPATRDSALFIPAPRHEP